MENVENISPKDGRQMVNVDKILLELFHLKQQICTTIHTFPIFALIPKKNTCMCSPLKRHILYFKINVRNQK
jgi:hypothetical protein